MERVVSLASSLRAEGYDIRFVDAGGGLGIQYEHSPEASFAAQAKQYAKALLGPLKRSRHCIFCSSLAAPSWAPPEPC